MEELSCRRSICLVVNPGEECRGEEEEGGGRNVRTLRYELMQSEEWDHHTGEEETERSRSKERPCL